MNILDEAELINATPSEKATSLFKKNLAFSILAEPAVSTSPRNLHPSTSVGRAVIILLALATSSGETQPLKVKLSGMMHKNSFLSIDYSRPG